MFIRRSSLKNKKYLLRGLSNKISDPPHSFFALIITCFVKTFVSISQIQRQNPAQLLRYEHATYLTPVSNRDNMTIKEVHMCSTCCDYKGI